MLIVEDDDVGVIVEVLNCDLTDKVKTKNRNYDKENQDHVEDGDVVVAGHYRNYRNDDDDDKEDQDQVEYIHICHCRTHARSTPTAATTSTRVKQPTSTNVAGQAMTAEIRYPLPFSH